MLLLALFTSPHSAAIQGWKKLSKAQLYQAGHITQTVSCRRYLHFALPASRLSRTCSYALIDVDNELCGLMNAHCLVTITWAVFAKQSPERPPRTVQNTEVAVLVRW